MSHPHPFHQPSSTSAGFASNRIDALHSAASGRPPWNPSGSAVIAGEGAKVGDSAVRALHWDATSPAFRASPSPVPTASHAPTYLPHALRHDRALSDYPNALPAEIGTGAAETAQRAMMPGYGSMDPRLRPAPAAAASATGYAYGSAEAAYGLPDPGTLPPAYYAPERRPGSGFPPGPRYVGYDTAGAALGNEPARYGAAGQMGPDMAVWGDPVSLISPKFIDAAPSTLTTMMRTTSASAVEVSPERTMQTYGSSSSLVDMAPASSAPWPRVTASHVAVSSTSHHTGTGPVRVWSRPAQVMPPPRGAAAWGKMERETGAPYEYHQQLPYRQSEYPLQGPPPPPYAHEHAGYTYRPAPHLVEVAQAVSDPYGYGMMAPPPPPDQSYALPAAIPARSTADLDAGHPTPRLGSARHKPHICSVCGRQLIGGSTLRRHMLIHSGEKPFKCDDCGRCFRQKGTMINHRRTHKSGPNNFACLTCGISYKYRKTLANHVYSVHNVRLVGRQTTFVAGAAGGEGGAQPGRVHPE